VDRYRFDADPDPDTNFHVNADSGPDPDWHQNDAVPHADPSSCWKIIIFVIYF
jgi:hypothetical protein